MSEIYESEGDRPDQTPSLGKHLTVGQLRIYNLILNGGTESVSLKDILKKLHGGEVSKELYTQKNFTSLRVNIKRIREKLGNESIITDSTVGRKRGYRARRAVIENLYPSGKDKEKR